MRDARHVPRSAALAAVLGLALCASAASSRTITDSWPQLGFARDGNCELTISGNGKTLMIAASGLLPGERARFRLANAAIKPLDWRVLANRNGNWSQYYVPFQWGQAGGNVSVILEGSTCRMSASAPWAREVRVIP
jgi:hypothetical protein